MNIAKKRLIIAFCLTIPLSLFSEKFKDIKDFIVSVPSNYKTIGAIAPFSKNTAKAIFKSVLPKINDLQKDETLMFLEVGPGTGALSQHFVNKLEKLKINYQLDLVELNPEFCDILKEKFKGNSKVNIYCHDITTWKTTNKYHLIASTLPFNMTIFTPDLIKTILSKYESLIKVNGMILYVEYILMGNIKKIFLNSKEKTEYENKHEILNAFREKHSTITETVLANIPPTYVYLSTIQ